MTYQTEYARNNTGGSGTPVFAYTAMLGNGVTATLSIEDYTERRANVVGVTAASFAPGVDNAALNHGNETPDIVGNLRVDQAWGSAQVSGALHLNQATYYGAPAGRPVTAHPDDKWGWAVGAGILLKMPWDAEGHLRCRWSLLRRRDHLLCERARLVRCSFVGCQPVPGWRRCCLAGGMTLTSATPRSRSARTADGLERAGWLPALLDQLAAVLDLGLYSDYEANSATIDTLVCAARGFGPGCADWNAWQVGSRTIWNPVTNLDIGLEVMYTKVETAFGGARLSLLALLVGYEQRDPLPHRIQDNDVWSGILRIQRNFWP